MKPRFFTLMALVLAAALSRIVPHPWNVTPVAAMALFAGAHFSSRRAAYLVPLIALAISDAVLGSVYDTILFVYAGFLLAVFIGTRIRERHGAATIFGAALMNSIAFFVITNFGHWLVSGMYPHTSAGLSACFTAAIPFYRNSLAGDLIWTGAFFGGFSLLERVFPALREATLSARLPLVSH